MPNQVGQVETFAVMGTPPSQPLAYVFSFWDGSSITTAYGSTTKELNAGGNPANSPAFTLPFRVDVCDRHGNSQVITGTVGVNNPPTVFGAPTITPNDAAFPFVSQVVTRAYDLEEAGGILFLWYDGARPIASGVTANVGATPGTYAGTWAGANKTVYQNTVSHLISQGTVLTCKIVDVELGTTALDYRFNGFDPAAPRFSVAAQPDSLTADATTLPDQYIGSQPVVLTATASDTQTGSLAFYWSFYGSNGWEATDIPYFSTGQSSPTQTGWRSDVTRSVSGELTTGLRTVDVSVTNVATGKSALASIQVTLVRNENPAVSAVNSYRALTGVLETSFSQNVGNNNYVCKFSGTATDPNRDVLYYQWELALPTSPVENVTLYGRDVYVDVRRFSTGAHSLGTMKAVDRLGLASSLFTLPSITVTA